MIELLNRSAIENVSGGEDKPYPYTCLFDYVKKDNPPAISWQGPIALDNTEFCSSCDSVINTWISNDCKSPCEGTYSNVKCLKSAGGTLYISAGIVLGLLTMLAT